MSRSPSSDPPVLRGDHVLVTVVGYGLDGTEQGLVDFVSGQVLRGAAGWRPEPLSDRDLASVRAAAVAVHGLGDTVVRPSQFTLGEVQFHTTFGGRTHRLSFTDENGQLDEPLHTVWRVALHAPRS